ncbi:hypothetical protein ACHAPE_009479 [Trichoderma viride]
MSAYLITGVSRGIGFEFLKQLSSNPSNIVIGLVRDKSATDEKIKTELSKSSNVHILEADITDYDALQKSALDIAKITPKLDYIIANAAFVSTWSAYDAIGDLGNSPQELQKDLLDSFNINVVGNIHLFNLYMPLVLKGSVKKVITISSGMADPDFVAKYKIASGAPYSISKAAMNVAVAKFSAQYSKDGVLFMSISPGLVDTGGFVNTTEEQQKGAMEMVAKFAEYAPNFTGPVTPEVSVKQVLSVINKANIESGDSGSFVSHLGNKKWL